MTTLELPPSFTLQVANPGDNPYILPPEVHQSQSQPQPPVEVIQPIQATHEAAPEPISSPAPAQETAHVVDLEVERLIAFDRALRNGDQSTISAILGRAREASMKTGSSEYSYLTSRRAAHLEGRPHEEVLREEAELQRQAVLDRALDREVLAGNDTTPQTISRREAVDDLLERTRQEDPRAYEKLMDRLAEHRRTYKTPEDIQRHAEFAPEWEALYGDKEIVAEDIADHVGEVAVKTEDQGQYAQTVEEEKRNRESQAAVFYKQHPELLQAFAQRRYALIQLVNSGLARGNVRAKADQVFAIIDAAEAEAEKTGFWDGYHQLRSILPATTMSHPPL